MNKFPESPKYAGMGHVCDMVTSFNITITSQIDVHLACGSSFFIFPMGCYV